MLFGITEGPSEEYELVEQGPSIRDSRSSSHESVSTSSASNPSRRSTESETSVVFESIDGYSRQNNCNDDLEDFTNNMDFQTVMQSYKGIKGISKKSCSILSGTLFALWIIGLIVYSNGTAVTLVSNLKWQTNVEVSGKNVTLNNYNSKYNNITIDGYRRGIYYSFKEDVRWLNVKQYPTSHESGGYYLTRGKKGSFDIKQINNGEKETLIENIQFHYRNNFFYIEDMILNPAKSVGQLNDVYHIVVTDKLDQWRQSSFALYWLFKPATSEYIPIQPPSNLRHLNNPEVVLDKEVLDKLHFAEFSPKGDYIIFGFNHNLYIQNLKTNEINEITNDGSSHIFNGKPDWIYEEEVIADYKLFWWSPNQESLIYIKLNDTNVQEYELDYYIKDATEVGSQYEKLDKEKIENVNQYPIRASIKYPKPGTPNPIVSVHNFKIAEKKITNLISKDSNLGEDFILYDAVWIDDKKFLMRQTDRTSKILSKTLFQPEISDSEVIEISSINVTEQYNGWVEKLHPITIISSDDENKYVEKVVLNGRTHLALFDKATSSQYSKLLTESSEWDIVLNSPVVYDKNEDFLYVLTTMRSSMDSHLIGIDLSKDKDNIVIITDIDKDGIYDVDFSDDGQYLNLYYKGPLQPWQRLINMQEVHHFIQLNESKGQSGVDVLISKHHSINHVDITATALENTNIPTKIYKTISVGKFNDKSPITLNAIEILPPNFNPYKQKYPLLVHAYGGPGSQTVDKSFAIDFQDVVSASLNAIVLIIDPRGTGGQSWKFRSFATGKIGYWEPRDLTTVVSEYIAVNKHFINEQKVAIWGWSYGGFTTLKTLEYDAGKTFKFGMAVAPVTNWLFYDSIYTERYMNLPSQNENYEKYARINDYEHFKSLKRFLIMHGTSDDNVHLQNSLWLLDKLNLKNVENYDVHFFPDSDHSIRYHNANNIIYDKLLHWLGDAFAGRFDDNTI